MKRSTRALVALVLAVLAMATLATEATGSTTTTTTTTGTIAVSPPITAKPVSLCPSMYTMGRFQHDVRHAYAAHNRPRWRHHHLAFLPYGAYRRVSGEARCQQPPSTHKAALRVWHHEYLIALSRWQSQNLPAKGEYTIPMLERLWVISGGPTNVEYTAAVVATCESGAGHEYATTWAYNHSGATGLWQILGAPSGTSGDPTIAQVNGKMAVAKYVQAGDSFSPWAPSESCWG